MEDNGNIWFFTDIGSDKIDEIINNNQINFSFSNESENEYVSVSGTAYPVKDQEKINELWNVFVKAWFPEGKKSDALTLVKVQPETAQYWDGSSSKIIQMYKIAKAVATGKSYEKVTDAENNIVVF
ncbi:MAG: pyridoxamine 5'-phosphate oxidase family protein [Bacteroidota bacterium]